MRTEEINSPTRRCCLNCHFLVDNKSDDAPFSVDKSTREKLREQLTKSDPRRMTSNIVAQNICYKGVWAKGSVVQEVTKKIAEIRNRSSEKPVDTKPWDASKLIEDRGESCFFYSYGDRLDLETAAELERRLTARLEVRRDRRVAKWIIVATIAGTVIGSALTAVFSK